MAIEVERRIVQDALNKAARDLVDCEFTIENLTFPALIQAVDDWERFSEEHPVNPKI